MKISGMVLLAVSAWLFMLIGSFPALADTAEKIVTIPAKPEPVKVDLARTAVVIVDMQNAFATKGECLTLSDRTYPRLRVSYY